MSVDDIGELEIGECETVSNLLRDEFLLFLRINSLVIIRTILWDNEHCDVHYIFTWIELKKYYEHCDLWNVRLKLVLGLL